MTHRPRGGPGGTVRLDEPTDFRAEVAREIKSRHAPVVRVIAGPDIGLVVKLVRPLTVGRSPEAGLPLTDGSVSYVHARLEDRGDTWGVVDLGSTNGLRVDDVPCTEAALQPDTKIQLGTTVLRFEVHDADDQAYDEMLQRLISTDDLTGLYVRRRFDRDLAQMLAAAEISGERVALLVMDLDGLKKLNDTHGHLYGAHVIGEAGRRIARVIPDGMIASRFGGDEYVVAGRGLDRDTALALAEHIRSAVADFPYAKDGLELRVGLSVGVATFPDDSTSLETLFQCADEAMYRAKRDGKNCVRR